MIIINSLSTITKHYKNYYLNKITFNLDSVIYFVQNRLWDGNLYRDKNVQFCV